MKNGFTEISTVSKCFQKIAEQAFAKASYVNTYSNLHFLKCLKQNFTAFMNTCPIIYENLTKKTIFLQKFTVDSMDPM